MYRPNDCRSQSRSKRPYLPLPLILLIPLLHHHKHSNSYILRPLPHTPKQTNRISDQAHRILLLIVLHLPPLTIDAYNMINLPRHVKLHNKTAPLLRQPQIKLLPDRLLISLGQASRVHPCTLMRFDKGPHLPYNFR